ncbi:hypothetical protein R1flu_013378 [Riccia fluitans]|uniref:Uncharacterized protein n=1 Tax=Riccia fluitans TaxID=41844 RepID=A0ABD1YG92_9MARC
MIMGYLEGLEHLVDILGSGRKTKVSGKHPSKQTAFGVMVVHLASLGFPVCIGAIMQKKFDRYLASFKKAKEWSMSTEAGMIEEEVTRGMTIEDKLNQRWNEGGSPVEGDEPAHAEKGGSGGEGDEIVHAESENFDDEFGDDGGAPYDETEKRSEEELEAQPRAQPFIHVQPSSVERPHRATSSSQQTNE